MDTYNSNSKIQIFNNSQFGEVRVAVGEDSEPLFCLVDICKALDLGNPSQVKTRLNANGVKLLDMGSLLMRA